MKKGREDALGVVLVLASLGLVGAVIVLVLRHGSTRQQLDERGCPVDGPPPTNAVVLYDASDRLAGLQREWLQRRLSEWIDDTPIHGRIQLYVLPRQASELSPAFDRCNPGSGEDASWLFANPARLKRRWEELFERPAEKALGELPNSVQPYSPLLEALQLLSVRAGLESRAGGERRLFLISDMLQHSPAVSLYGGGCASAEERVRSQRLLGDLGGVDVVVKHIRRDESSACRPRELIALWERLFRAMGATLVDVEAVPGLAPGSSAGGPGA